MKRVASEGIIDEHRPTPDRLLAQKAPVAGIFRIVAVIAQREVLSRGDDQRTPVIAGWAILTRSIAMVDQVSILLSHPRIGRIGEGILISRVWLGLRHPVQVQDLVAHLQRVAR